MAQSKEWNWKEVQRENWMRPSEDSEYLADKWEKEAERSITIQKSPELRWNVR